MIEMTKSEHQKFVEDSPKTVVRLDNLTYCFTAGFYRIESFNGSKKSKEYLLLNSLKNDPNKCDTNVKCVYTSPAMARIKGTVNGKQFFINRPDIKLIFIPFEKIIDFANVEYCEDLNKDGEIILKYKDLSLLQTLTFHDETLYGFVKLSDCVDLGSFAKYCHLSS